MRHGMVFSVPDNQAEFVLNWYSFFCKIIILMKKACPTIQHKPKPTAKKHYYSFWYKWFITTDALFTPYWFYFSSYDLSYWSSFVGLVSTRSARVHALCSRCAPSSRLHQQIGRQVLAPAQWDICFAWPANQWIFDVLSGLGSQFWG